MTRGPKLVAIVLTTEERDVLQRLVRRRGAGQAAVMRARIVLAADAEPQTTNKAIAAHLGISRQNVITWRQRFLAHRLDGLVNRIVYKNKVTMYQKAFNEISAYVPISNLRYH